MTKLYTHRDPFDLEPHYSAHVSAMTEEGLHAKSDIAAELAFRDAQLEAGKATLEDEKAASKVKAVKLCTAHQDTLGLLKRVQVQRDRLAEALLDTREGNDIDDGGPCWCDFPSYARAHSGRHIPRCVKARAALEPDLGRELDRHLQERRDLLAEEDRCS